jgi:hypothetical protein
MLLPQHSILFNASATDYCTIGGGGGYARSITAHLDFYNSSLVFCFRWLAHGFCCSKNHYWSSKNASACSENRSPCLSGHFSCSKTQNPSSENHFLKKNYGFCCSENHFPNKKTVLLGQNRTFFSLKPIFYAKQQVQGCNTRQCR